MDLGSSRELKTELVVCRGQSVRIVGQREEYQKHTSASGALYGVPFCNIYYIA